MYNVKSITCNQFVNDLSIKAPRFQRKLVWKYDKNYEFCISFFNEFPIGVVVVNHDKAKYDNINSKGKNIKKLISPEQKYLLDGRQRFNILNEIYYNPEKIYDYAKSYLNLKSNMNANDINKVFWEKIEDFLQNSDDNEDNLTDSECITDENENNQIDNEESNNENEDNIIDSEEISDENEDNIMDSEEISGENEDNIIDSEEISDENEDIPKANEPEIDPGEKYLEKLLRLKDIIIATHPKKKNYSGFTKPFDFSCYLKKLPYIEENGRVKRLKCKELMIWIRNFKLYIENNQKNISKDELLNYLDKNYEYKENKNKISLNRYILKNWEEIEDRINICSSIDNRMNSAEIGWIVLEDCTAKEAQKIYEIINTKGTPLTNPEILSAKAEWNIPIESDDIELNESKDKLYKTMNISVPKGLVKWDIVATFIDRLGENFIFGNLSYKNETQFNTKLNLGFKLISGIIKNKIDQVGIEEIGKAKEIKWCEFTVDLLSELKKIINILESDSFFSKFASYKYSLLALTSEAVVLNFLIVLHKDWKRKGEPKKGSQNWKDFVLNAKILFDSLIYNYVNRDLRGTSDSEVARRLKAFDTYENNLISRIDDELWKDLIENAIDNNVIREKPLAYKGIDKMLKVLLVYYYTLDGKAFSGDKVNFDHIIPRIKLEKKVGQWESKVSNIFNLCILNDTTNKEKYSRFLNEINKHDMKREISESTGIQAGDFDKYSNINAIDELKIYRKDLFLKVFGSVRTEKLSVNN